MGVPIIGKPKTPEEAARILESVAHDLGFGEVVFILTVPPVLAGGKPSLHIHIGGGNTLIVAATTHLVNMLGQLALMGKGGGVQ